jgi:hypothetical protein
MHCSACPHLCSLLCCEQRCTDHGAGCSALSPLGQGKEWSAPARPAWNEQSMDPSLTRCYSCALCCLALPGHGSSLQFLCPVCETWQATRYKHGSQCNDCHHREQRHPSSPQTPWESTSEHSPPLSMFGRPPGCIDQLTEIERSAIVTLHRVGWTQRDIAHSAALQREYCVAVGESVGRGPLSG